MGKTRMEQRGTEGEQKTKERNLGAAGKNRKKTEQKAAAGKNRKKTKQYEEQKAAVGVTLEEINGIYYISKEIEGIQREMAELQNKNLYKPINLSGMPKGNKDSDMFVNYAEKSIRLEEMLDYNLKKLQEEREKTERFIEAIEDREMRAIIRLRCVNNMKWDEIGKCLSMDRRTVSRKFYNFFKKK